MIVVRPDTEALRSPHLCPPVIKIFAPLAHNYWVLECLITQILHFSHLDFLREKRFCQLTVAGRPEHELQYFETVAGMCVSRNNLTLTLQLLQEWFGDFLACFLHVRLQIMWQKSRFKTFLETNDGKMDQGDPDGDIFRGVLCSLPRVACCILYLQPVKISQFSIFFFQKEIVFGSSEVGFQPFLDLQRNKSLKNIYNLD